MGRLIIGFLVLSIFAVAAYASNASLESDKISNEIPEAIEIKKDSTRAKEEEFDEIFRKIKVALENGIESLGIPPMNPLKIDKVELNGIQNSLISGDLYLSNLVVKGITDFIGKGSAVIILGIPLSATVSLKFPTLELVTDYTANLNLFGMMDLHGAGKIHLVLTNFNTAVTVGLKLPSIGVTDFTFQLPSTEAQITGLFNDEYMSKIISKQLTDTLNTLAKEENERITQIIRDALDKIIQEIIEGIINKPGGDDESPSNFNQVEFYQSLMFSVIEKVQQMNSDEIPLLKKLKQITAA